MIPSPNTQSKVIKWCKTCNKGYSCTRYATGIAHNHTPGNTTTQSKEVDEWEIERKIDGICKGVVGENGLGVYDLSELRDLYMNLLSDTQSRVRREMVEKINVPDGEIVNVMEKAIRNKIIKSLSKEEQQ
jgi:hypothetical protein